MKLFGEPEVEVSNFCRKASRVKDIGIKISMTNTVFFVGLTTVATIATAIVYGFGGSLVISEVLTLGISRYGEGLFDKFTRGGLL